MFKRLMISTAAAALVVGSAVAQQPSPPASPTTPPMMQKDMPATGAAASRQFITQQSADQWVASKFKGTDVIGNDNEKIGDVSDILFDKTGKIEAYVVGVGGFLGIGAKDVALAPSAFQVVTGDKSKNESDKLKISMTKDELKQAANFEPYKAPSATTGMGGAPGSRPAPAGGGMAR